MAWRNTELITFVTVVVLVCSFLFGMSQYWLALGLGVVASLYLLAILIDFRFRR